MHIHESGWVATVEDLQTPRHRCLAAEKLLIEVVPETADRLRENDAGGHRVGERGKRDATTSAGDPRTHTAQGDGTPDSQAAIPDAQRRSRSGTTLTEIGAPVGRHVIQPAADEPERHCPQRDVVSDTALAAASLPTSIADQQRSDDPGDDEQRVGSDGHWSQMPHSARRTRKIRDDSRRHDSEVLWRTPAASSSVNVRIVDNPAVRAERSAEPTLTPSA